ncbi:hypothetical protein D8674_018854 [Pyrus ussuriensis x Pyrus communis]|uniref:Uncharacterized protein n=1 Tax=Pyrus ussuriensis x Pyrus communis TaxID=2448454 RepID=A0A5N5GBK3_9ROSA|nr:hypothetical protein D8674_018854 [Pyrus ussuriensis x Pyrus communis]
MAVEDEAFSLTSLKQEEEEEERESFLALSSSTCKVVEYLQPVMSKELLCKFPDNSAFDFDYTQSSIWSPLVPRAYAPMDLDMDLDLDFWRPRKLNLEMGLGVKNQNSSLVDTGVGSGIKKKKISTTATCFNLNRSALKNKVMKRKKSKMVLASDFSPTPVKINCNPIASKVWNKVLKAASKHFKKKKRDPMDHVRLSNYLRSDGSI